MKTHHRDAAELRAGHGIHDMAVVMVETRCGSTPFFAEIKESAS